MTLKLGPQLRTSKGALVGLVLIVWVLLRPVNGTVDCKTQFMKCHYCDSRTEPHCQDPFNSTRVTEKAEVNTAECNGCCVKFKYYLDNEEFVLRTCLRNMVVHHLEGGKDVCMDEQFGQNKLCVCVEDLCNGGNGGLDREKWTLLVGFVAFMALSA